MLINPQTTRRTTGPLPATGQSQLPLLLRAVATGLPLLLVSLWPGPPLAAAEDPPVTAEGRAPRPPDLKILWRSESVLGSKQIGVFGAKADARQPGLWSVQVWEETRDRVTIATDRIGCTLQMPVRITGTGRQTYVRQLNPGGAIHDANRLDHLIWWAVCQPDLAGRDPAGLGKEARRLGFSGNLREQQDVVLSSP